MYVIVCFLSQNETTGLHFLVPLESLRMHYESESASVLFEQIPAFLSITHLMSVAHMYNVYIDASAAHTHRVQGVGNT